MASRVAAAAAHTQFQGFELNAPARDTRESMRLRNALVLALLATNSEAVVREGVIEQFDGSGHARKFAGR